MKYTKREIQELDLVDNFLFNEMICSEHGNWFCQLLIKRICNRKAGRLKVFSQDYIQGIDTNLHGIRMDVYIRDGDDCVYDIEPDKYTTLEHLPKRCRFYRGMIDSRLLETGIPYSRLPDMCLIFILPYDPVGKNRMIYRVKNYIGESGTEVFRDGAVTFLVNTKGNIGGNTKLKQLLHYLEHSVEENAVNEELAELHKYVTKIKENKKAGVRFMMIQEFKEIARQEGMEQGVEKGKREIIFNMLKDSLPIEKISKYSGQPEEYIYQVQDEMKMMLGERTSYKTE